MKTVSLFGGGGRPPERIDSILDDLKRVWKKYPDLRLSQLILMAEHEKCPLFNMEDDQLIKTIRRKLYESGTNTNTLN